MLRQWLEKAGVRITRGKTASMNRHGCGGGETERVGKAAASRRTPKNQESSLRRMSFTAWGLALARGAFMTWPTKNLKTPSLPDLNFATFAGSFAMISPAAWSIAGVLTLA